MKVQSNYFLGKKITLKKKKNPLSWRQAQTFSIKERMTERVWLSMRGK